MAGGVGAPSETFPVPEVPSMDLAGVPFGPRLLLGLPLCPQAWSPEPFRPDGVEAGCGGLSDPYTHPGGQCRTRPGHACFLSVSTSPNTGWAKRDASECWEVSDWVRVGTEWKWKALLQGELQLVCEQRSSSTALPHHLLALSHRWFRMSN